ncbi:hypothetical protein [Streptacidiphilus cavernicola]|uniref:Uncharacterized protein n=1 Tax=Streptacidiphilus cavernicola TaxID=3342716 RepID=A0ABV6W017_9ACTN
MTEPRPEPEPEPGVRRLCVALAADAPGLLATARRSGRLDRLYVSTDGRGGIEVGVAPPGVDELGLMRDLVGVLRREVSRRRHDLSRPVLLVLHVGIIRAVDGGLGGAGTGRSRELARDREIRAAADGAGGPGGLTLIVSEALYADLRAEGLSGLGWQLIASAGAWIRSFGPASDSRTDRDGDF